MKQKDYRSMVYGLLFIIYILFITLSSNLHQIAWAHNYQGGTTDLITGIEHPNGNQQTFYPGEMAQIAFDVSKPKQPIIYPDGSKKVVKVTYEDRVDLGGTIGPGLVWTDISQISHNCEVYEGSGTCSSSINGDESIKIITVLEGDQSVGYAKIRISYYGTSNKRYDHPPGTKYPVVGQGLSCKAIIEDQDGNLSEEACSNTIGTDHYMVACSEPPPVDLICNNPTQNGIVGNMPGCLLEWDVNYTNSVCLSKTVCHITPSDDVDLVDVNGSIINDDPKFKNLTGKGSRYVYLKPTKIDGGVAIGSAGAKTSIGPRIYNTAKILLKCDQYTKETTKEINIKYPPRLINPWLRTQDGDVLVSDIMGSLEATDNYCLQNKDSQNSHNIFIALGSIINYSQLYHYIVPKDSSNSANNDYYNLNDRLQGNNCLLGISGAGLKLNNPNNYQNVVYQNFLRELNLLSLLDNDNQDLNKIISYAPILTRDYSQLKNDNPNIKSFKISSYQSPSSDMGNKILLHQGDLDLSGFSYRSGITTIMVNGNVNINSDIRYSGSNQDLDNLAGVAILSSGNINISSKVTHIDAALMSSKNINLCYQYKGMYQDGQECSANLAINGPVVSNNLIFNRTNIEVSNKPLIPRSLISAATIYGTWKNYFTPPPGVDDRYSNRASQLEIDKRV